MKSTERIGRHPDAQRRLKIAIVSRGDARSGGAGRVAQLLAAGLRRSDITIRHIVRLLPYPSYRHACERLRGVPGDILVRNVVGCDLSGAFLLLKRMHRWADIIHFHDISVAYGISAAIWLSRRVPLCITLHDYSLITGGCLFPNSCLRFAKGCGLCPQIGSPPLTFPLDTTRLNYQKNKNFLSKISVTAIAPSEFIADQARLGAGVNAQLERIDNPVDTDLFSFAHRDRGRQFLNVSDGHKVLLLVASRLDDPRKGLFDFLAVFRVLGEEYPNLKLILVGQLQNKVVMSITKENIDYLGPIYNQKRLAAVFAAADCLVIPSIEDNVPCTVAESLSCGTPILARHTGGVSEMFDNNCQGILILDNTAREWGAAIEKALIRPQIESRYQIRQYALRRYGLKTFTDKHINLYVNLIHDNVGSLD